MRFLSALFLFFASFSGVRADAPAKFPVGGYEFTRPPEWKWVEPTSTMRKAQLQIPGKDGGKPADITFFFFGESNGGGVDANVQRWFGQLAGNPEANKAEPLEFNGVKVTMVTAAGTLKASPMAGIPEELPDAALVGAIVEHPEGAVFIKMTGPAELVKSSREKFTAMVKAAAEKK